MKKVIKKKKAKSNKNVSSFCEVLAETLVITLLGLLVYELVCISIEFAHGL